MRRCAALWVFVLLPLQAAAQPGAPPSLPFRADELQRYEIRDCRELGCDRQVVDPERAIYRWGQTYAASGWVERVRAQSAYRQRAVDATTCLGAVRALFKLICDDRPNCEIEARYDAECLGSSASQETKEKCVQVVDAYVERCFGSGCMPVGHIHEQGLIGGALIRANERPFCSGAGFNMPPPHDTSRWSPIAVTVEHCQARRGDVLTRFRPEAHGHLVDPVDQGGHRVAFSPSVKAFRVEERARYPLGVRRPERFAQTLFQGYNSLIASRNRLVDRSRSISPLTCDSSPLCTIVTIDGDRLVHTCQSTKGGSGGALIQFIDGRWSMVGINDGSPGQGLVTDNRGFSILSSSSP